MKFAEMVKEARQKAGLSQGGLAQQMRTAKRPEGVWPTYVGQIEKGEKVPSEEICVKLAEVLALDLDELLLAAYESRADSEEARVFLQKMKRALTDPVISRLLADEAPLDPTLLDILADPALRAVLAQEEWRQVLSRTARSRKKRDLPGLLARLEAMNDKQWNGLLGLLDGMGL
jgi:transcriptional regulator with XRE-family HTH domain